MQSKNTRLIAALATATLATALQNDVVIQDLPKLS